MMLECKSAASFSRRLQQDSDVYYRNALRH